MSKAISYLGYMVMNRGTSVPVSTCQIEQKRTVLPLGALIGPSISYTTPYGFSEVRVTSRDKCCVRRSDSSDNGSSDRYPTLTSNLAFAPPRLCDTFSRYPVSFSGLMIARSAFGTVILRGHTVHRVLLDRCK